MQYYISANDSMLGGLKYFAGSSISPSSSAVTNRWTTNINHAQLFDDYQIAVEQARKISVKNIGVFQLASGSSPDDDYDRAMSIL